MPTSGTATAKRVEEAHLPKKIVKIKPKQNPLWEFWTVKINDRIHGRYTYQGVPVLVDLIKLQIIRRAKICKKHEEPGLGRNNPYFPGLREAIFHGRFPSEIPKSRLFLSRQRKPGKSGGVKSPHTCAFVIFGLLTRWLAGSEWVMGSKMGSRMAWIARPGRKSGLMLRKLGKKGATALFIITEQRHRLNGTQRPVVAAKLNRFENFLLTHRSYSALSQICI